MNDQLQTAKDWLGDLSKIVSRQKTKEDYEYAKKRTEALGYLINRVEELELTLESASSVTEDLEKEDQRYKQALEYAQSELEYAHVTGNMELRGESIKKALKAIDEALEGESQ